MKDERGPLNKAMADERRDYVRQSKGGLGLLLIAVVFVGVIFLLGLLLK